MLRLQTAAYTGTASKITTDNTNTILFEWLKKI
jgi:hypothetical protein